jgi:hypothetical protein
MRIRPHSRSRPLGASVRSGFRERRGGGAAFTDPSDLRLMILRMISLNSLAAFTAEVTRNAGLQPSRGVAGARGAEAAMPPPGGGIEPVSASPAQRPLGAVPPAPPSTPPPRGSLLDLRV